MPCSVVCSQSLVVYINLHCFQVFLDTAFRSVFDLPHKVCIYRYNKITIRKITDLLSNLISYIPSYFYYPSFGLNIWMFSSHEWQSVQEVGNSEFQIMKMAMGSHSAQLTFWRMHDNSQIWKKRNLWKVIITYILQGHSNFFYKFSVAHRLLTFLI